MNSNPNPSWSTGYVLLLLVLLVIAVLGAIYFDVYRFDPITFQVVVDILIPIVLIATFLERAQEVFISAWRDIGRAGYDQTIKRLKATLAGQPAGAQDAKAVSELESAEADLARYRAKTKRIAFLFSLAAGLLISIAGVRVLRPLTSMDADPVGVQRHLFNIVDIVLTGALIGGGSEGAHRVMSVITDFLDVTRQNIVNAKLPAAGQP
jgi:hypothetical protein